MFWLFFLFYFYFYCFLRLPPLPHIHCLGLCNGERAVVFRSLSQRVGLTAVGRRTVSLIASSGPSWLYSRLFHSFSSHRCAFHCRSSDGRQKAFFLQDMPHLLIDLQFFEPVCVSEGKRLLQEMELKDLQFDEILARPP